jgi:O-antigen/teichoic acid export membrane protein
MNITKHVLISFLYKGGSILSNFLIVPLTLNILDSENYGVWLTISSFISWFSFFDIGLGNGLRNKFAEAKAKGNANDALEMVSTAYISIAFISVLANVIFLGLNFSIDWTIVFNTKSSLLNDLIILMPILFGFFGIQLVAKLITSLYYAEQHHSVEGKIQFMGQLASLLLVLILKTLQIKSLLIYGILFSSVPVIIIVLINIIAFNGKFAEFKPKIAKWNWRNFNQISSLGFRFFVIQIAALILFSTDSYVINSLFGPNEVVPYNLAFRYFAIITMVYGSVIQPFWTSFTIAYNRNDIEWIKKSISTIQKIWFAIPILLLLMIFFASDFFVFWVGKSVTVSYSLTISMALLVAITTFNMIYVNFINGVGKISVQFYSSIITTIINIPLGIFMGKTLGLGPSGVILATCICLTYSAILKPFQYYLIINNRAKGIWDK